MKHIRSQEESGRDSTHFISCNKKVQTGFQFGLFYCYFFSINIHSIEKYFICSAYNITFSTEKLINIKQPKMKQFSKILITSCLFIAITAKVKAQVNPQDSLALVDFYDSTGGASWTSHTNWLTKAPVSKWFGITLDANYRVSKIRVTKNNLKGAIPASFFNMTNLTYLAFGNNALSGNISSSFGNLTQLQTLLLWSNKFTGTIPITLGNLTKLVTLELDQNTLTGTIPASLTNLTNLQTLYLSGNKLTGTIPATIGSLTNLTILSLSNNQLTGTIPSSIGSLTNLTSLSLSTNQLTGTIPSSIGSLYNLTSLNLGYNKLSGTIPDLGNLTSLTGLYLYSNVLTGTIPLSIGNLTNLNYLYLWGNKLSGSIPDTLGNLTNLQYLILSSNSLSGRIPKSIGNLSSLSFLSLWGNQLGGSIPDTIGNLSNLTYLYLQTNQFSGKIPESIGNLGLLNTLYLFGNQLSGSIPSTFGNLTTLTALALNNNLLSGSIPSSLLNLKKLKSLYLNNNQFTFAGMEAIAPAGFADSIKTYSPQSTVNIQQNGNQLSFSVGGTLANNTYQWYQDGNLVATKVGDSTFTVTSIGQYSVMASNSIATDLTLYSNNLDVTVLPINSIALQAKETDGVVNLQWQTIGESNSTNFAIQHSIDGKTFTEISIASAIGKGNNNYNLLDKHPASGTNYYRIKSLDKLGNINYSNVASLATFNSRLTTLSVYPNPTTDKITINGIHIASFSLANNLGKTITTVQLNDASNPSLQVSNLAAGTYYLHINTSLGEAKTLQFIKK